MEFADGATWSDNRRLSQGVGYDIGCIYPENMLSPFNARGSIAGWASDYVRSIFSETPMFIRTAHLGTMCQATCLTYHDSDVRDPLTNEPIPSVGAYGQNAWSITMCLVQCYVSIMEETFSKDAAMEYMDHVRTTVKLPEIRDPNDHMDVKDATLKAYNKGNTGSIEGILARDNFHPLTFGLMAGFRVMDFVKDDGWNADGMLQYSHKQDAAVPCTGNCRRFQDTVGYTPVPDPRTFPDLSEDETVYNCTGLCRRWQPLQEGDEAGSLKNQEFVVPHIGKYAHTYLREPSLTLSDPEYDLYADSLQVIEEVKMTSSDNYKKAAVKLFDDKGRVRRVIQTHLRNKFNFSFQDYLLYIYGMSAGEYDGIVQAWHEKTAHDLVRPTTVIKHWDDDMLMTFGGDPDHDGPVEIAARDFEAFIRVMPHPEFPSGSSCLCTTYMEFTDIYTNDLFGRMPEDIVHWEDDIKFTFTNMTDIRDHCSDSRIWGGVHYPAAVPAGEEICEGIGNLAFQWVTETKQGSNFNNKPYYHNDERPMCET